LIPLICRLAAITAVLLGFSAVCAQTYPIKPVRFIVPFPAGGAGVDALARGTAQALSDIWRQPVVVDNRGGASGIIGAELAAKSAADGYTLFFAPDPVMSTHPLLFKNLPYDPIKDFAPITTLAILKQGLAVSAAIPVTTVQEFVNLARAKPDALNYGSLGSGSAPHLAMEFFKRVTDIKVAHVPYKGPAPLVTDLIGGTIHSTLLGTSGNLVAATAQGRVRLLAVEGPQRSTQFPDVPTFAEAGYAGFRAPAWFGIVAPARTPKAIIDKVNRDLVAIIRNAEFREKFIGAGRDPGGGTPEEFAALIQDSNRLWAPIVKALNITLD